MGEFRLEKFTLVKQEIQAERFFPLSHSDIFNSNFEQFIDNTIVETCGHAPWCGDRTPTTLMSTYRPGRKNILITRDGRDCVVSWFYHCIRRKIYEEPKFEKKRAIFDQDPAYYENNKHKLLTETKYLKQISKSWNDSIVENMQTLEKAKRKELDLPYFWIRYEELVKQTDEIRANMYRFLNLDPTQAKPLDEQTSPGFEKHNPHSHYRMGKSGRWRLYFTKKQHRIFLNEAKEAMELLGLPTAY